MNKILINRVQILINSKSLKIKLQEVRKSNRINTDSIHTKSLVCLVRKKKSKKMTRQNGTRRIQLLP